MVPHIKMANEADGKELPARLRRTMELVYGVNGVLAARVWQWPGRMAVGVRGDRTTSAAELLRRVELVVAPMHEPEESWDFGILDDSLPQAAK